MHPLHKEAHKKVSAAIARSASHDEIVHLRTDSLQERDALYEQLQLASDDFSVGNHEAEFWVVDDEDEMIWRVHLWMKSRIFAGLDSRQIVREVRVYTPGLVEVKRSEIETWVEMLEPCEIGDSVCIDDDGTAVVSPCEGCRDQGDITKAGIK